MSGKADTVSKSTIEVIRDTRKKASPLSRSEQTRRSIIKAAHEFLRENPFREMTVGALMAHAEVSRPAFYHYFADVHELMDTLLVDLQEQWTVESKIWLLAEGDPVPAFARALDGVVRIARDWGPLLRAVVESVSTDEKLEAAWGELVGFFDDAVTQRIELDQAQGLIPDFDARFSAIALRGMNVAAYVHHFGTPGQSDAKEVWRSLARIWICTLYGHRAWARVENYEFE